MRIDSFMNLNSLTIPGGYAPVSDGKLRLAHRFTAG
jgi:hypothetical protein